MSNLKIYLLIFMSSVLAYAGSIKYGFSQDDWYFLYISVAHNIGDVLNFFNPWSQSGFAFYRPLGTQLYFFLSRLTFGLSNAPLGMHIFMLFVHSLGGYFLFELARRLRLSSLQSILVSLLYVGSSVHFLSLYYIAATQQLLATTLMLYILYWSKTSKTKWPAYLAFILALLSKENALLLPAYLFLLSDWDKINWKTFWGNIKSLLPYIFIAIVYLVIRILSRVEVQSEYKPILDGRILNTLKIYASFLFGYYEKIQDYAMPSGVKQYLIDTRPYGYLTLIGSLLSVVMIGYSTITSILSKSWKRIHLQYLLIFILGVTPWLLLPDHIFPHYLDLPMAALALLLISVARSNKVAVIITGALLIANYGGIKSNENLHWTVARARLNEVVVPQLMARGLCRNNSVKLTGDQRLAKELSYSLSLNNGPRVVCSNRLLQVYYGETSREVGKIIDLKEIRQ